MAVDLTKRMFSDAKADELIQTIQDLPNSSLPFSSAFNNALLSCFENVAWINSDGNTYYNALAAALDGSQDGGHVFDNRFRYKASSGKTPTEYTTNFSYTQTGIINESVSNNILTFSGSSTTYAILRCVPSNPIVAGASISLRFKFPNGMSANQTLGISIGGSSQKGKLVIRQSGLKRIDTNGTEYTIGSALSSEVWHTATVDVFEGNQFITVDGALIYEAPTISYAEAATGLVFNNFNLQNILSVESIDVKWSY